MRFSAISAAVVASIVGFGGTLALVLAGAAALGATAEQTASWVTAICIAIGAEALFLSWWLKMPVMTAWSAAGLALLGASQGYTFEEAAGAFVVTGIMLTATGLFRPVIRLVEHIPPTISAGMLGGIMLAFVMNGAKAVALDPAFILPLAVLFFVVRLASPAMAVIIVLIVGVTAAIAFGRTSGPFEAEISQLVFVMPDFTLAGVFGLAVPLYLVTMASQNLPGLAVLRANGYEPPAGMPIAVTGAGSILIAFFGASCTNISAVTAAICTGDEAHPDPAKRWHTGPWYAACYFLFALFGASLVTTIEAMPVSLIMLVTALALLAPLANATTIAMHSEEERLAAIATFAVTASGVSFFGVGAAFWGLLTGLAIIFLQRAVWRKLQ